MTHSDQDKVQFFKSFNDGVVKHLSTDVLCKMVLPKCFESTVFLDSPSQCLVAQMLHPLPDDQATPTIQSPTGYGFLSVQVFRTHLIPLVLGKFRLHERHTRMILLQHFTGYLPALTSSEVHSTVLPEICLSVFDRYDRLSGLSLQALSSLVPVCGPTLVLNVLRQTEERLKQTHKLIPTVSHPVKSQSVTPPSTAPSEWPRGHLFAEAAPKISRQQRDLPANAIPLSKPIPLAQKAALSAEYEPDSNAQLALLTEAELSPDPPVSLMASAVKVSTRREVANGFDGDSLPSLANGLGPVTELTTVHDEQPLVPNDPCNHPTNDLMAVTLTDMRHETKATTSSVIGCKADVEDEETTTPPKKKKSSKKSSRGAKRDAPSTSVNSATALEDLGDEAIATLGREYYFVTIRQLERRVASLTAYLEQLNADNDQLLSESVTVDEEEKDRLSELKETFKGRIHGSADLVERIYGKHALHKVEKRKWQTRERELKTLRQVTEDRLNAENQALSDELQALEEFRANRETLLKEYRELEMYLYTLQSDHTEALHQLDERDVAFRGRLKKATGRRINEVASEFRTLAYHRTEPTFKRMLAENVSIESQLVKLSTTVADLSADNAGLAQKFHTMTEERNRLDLEEGTVVTRCSAASKLAYLLTLHQGEVEHLLEEAKEGCHVLNVLNQECERIREADAFIRKSIETLENKCEQKRNNITCINERLSNHGNLISHTSNDLSKAAKSIQTLLLSQATDNDEEACRIETAKTIKLVLQSLKCSVAREPSQLQSEKTISSHADSMATVSCLRFLSDVENDLYDPMQSDEESSGISEPHSSRCVDSDLEVSEPEGTIESTPLPAASHCSRNTATASSLHASISDATVSGKESEGKLTHSETRMEMESLDRIWCRTLRSNLDNYGPRSKEWCQILDWRNLIGREYHGRKYTDLDHHQQTIRLVNASAHATPVSYSTLCRSCCIIWIVKTEQASRMHLETSEYANLDSMQLRMDKELSPRVEKNDALRIDQKNKNFRPVTAEMEKRLKNVKERIHGNIDALDYLRGISGLEKPFTDLVEDVLRTASVLSGEDNSSHPEFVFDPDMDEKVDQCWNYINQLTDAVHWYVGHAVEYHKFHHAVKTAQMELDKVICVSRKSLDELKSAQQLTMNQLDDTDRLINQHIAKLNQLANSARQLSIQSRDVAPLHHRQFLSKDPRSAQMLASIRLPDGDWVHRGDPVKVWASNQASSKLHHEWQAQTSDGTQTTTLPSMCMWLTSPETSPLGSLRDDEVKCPAAYANEIDFSSMSCGANNRASAEKLRRNVLENWMDLTDEIGRHLLPTYRNYMQYLQSIEGAIPVTDEVEMKELMQNLKPLMRYTETDEILLLGELQKKPLILSARDPALTDSDLRQLSRTLNSWNVFRDHCEQVKRINSPRAIEEEIKNRIPKTRGKPGSIATKPLTQLIRPSTAEEQFDPTIDQSLEYSEDILATDELVTSFAEPAPRTFRIFQDGSTHCMQQSVPTGDAASSSRLRHRRLQPNALNADKHDLMTQITTPSWPTRIVCPHCYTPYDVDSQEQQQLQHSSPGRTPSMDPVRYIPTRSSSASSQAIPVDIIEPIPMDSTREPRGRRRQHERLTDSTPVLTQVDERMKGGNKGQRGRRKLWHFSRHRSHSGNTSLTDNTGSSGLGSSPDPITMEASEQRQKRTSSKKPMKETEKTKSSRTTSLFRWGKRDKSKSRDVINPVVNLKPELSFRDEVRIDSPHSQSEVVQPIVRSRSWIQKGTPWGFGPPLNDRWYPTDSSNSPYAMRRLPSRISRVQSHSDRIQVRASRPKLILPDRGSQLFGTTSDHSLNTVTDWHPYETMDSGIQTDTDMTVGLQDSDKCIAKGLSPTLLQEKPHMGECSQCRRGISHALVDAQVQISSSFMKTTPEDRITSSRQHMTPKTVEAVQVDLASKAANHWDVSCQVGVRYLDHSVSVGIEAPAPLHLQTAATQVDKFAEQRPVQFDVNCQIGSCTREAAIGSEAHEAVELLDEQLRQLEQTHLEPPKEYMSIATQTTGSNLVETVNKKLQVGKSSLSGVLSMADSWTSPIESLVHSPTRTESVFEPKIDINEEMIPSMHALPTVKSDDICTSTVSMLRSRFDSEASHTREVLKSSCSTQIGRVTKTEESQTILSMIDELPSLKEKSSVSTDTNNLCSARVIDVQTDFSNPYYSVSTQVGSSGESQNYSTMDFETVSIKPIEKVASTGATSEEMPLRSTSRTQSSCPKCSHQYHVNIPVPQTRSKRIQKGSPTLQQHKHEPPNPVEQEPDTSEIEIMDDASMLGSIREPGLDKGVATANAKRRTPRHGKPQRVVVDIGLFGDGHLHRGRTTRGKSVPSHMQRRGDILETDTTSTDSPLTSTDDTIAPVCGPIDRIRMSLYLSGSNRWTRNKYHPRRRYRPQAKRSWSVDDVRVNREGTVRTMMHEETEETRINQSERHTLPSQRSGLHGTARRIDRMKQKYETVNH